MMYLGDFPTSAMIDFNWSSNSAAGASITRATNGTVSVYKANGTTQSTTGVTDTEDFDSLTGIHHCRIDTSSDGTFYAAGSEFSVVLSAATNNNVSSRTSTTATVTWTATSIGAGAKNAPELKTVIQEITDRAGWSSGNALALIIWGRSGASLLRWNQYDNGSGASSLSIDYTDPPAATVGSKTARVRLGTKVGGLLTA